jgi:phage shock protein PspC (stress-responsive transcriptional regulator)
VRFVIALPLTRLLRRSSEDFYFLGVCGGLGRYFGIDPGYFRVLLILVPPLWFPYLAIGVLMPVERSGEELGPPTPRMQRRADFRARHGGGVGATLGTALRRHALRRD